jgi:beta-galactosidase
MKMNRLLSALLAFAVTANIFAQGSNTPVRERLLMDFGWRFALGHPFDPAKDFGNGTSYFSYITKTGYGDGAAAQGFDDRTWRPVDLPHDWAVELPFSAKGGHSHGYKAIGRDFPENSVGWYRKKFTIPQTDLGRRISIDFDGIHRNASIWINGFYVGTQASGYISTSYDITDYINYGSENVVAVRVDVTMEEGWYYEGAGIYRHVWLNKIQPLHVARYGTFVTTDLTNNNSAATITARTTIQNENRTAATFSIEQSVVNAEGKVIAEKTISQKSLQAGTEQEFYAVMNVNNPQLWSIETPYLHKLVTVVKSNGTEVDRYETNFGIRTVRFDANEGFFLNGKHVKIKGTNNHQDHAGVGTAIPDALQEFRIARLKEMGSNAIRTSHNPPTPEMLDACDRMGMLVLDENRLMGINPYHFNQVKSMMMRDRNHPSVIIWSLGNEEWGIEGNIKGARIASTMQAYAQQLDSSRRFTVAVSGGWGAGISTTIDVMGFNYLTHGSIDQQHKDYPNQPAVGTEETTTEGTRGIYEDDIANGRMKATDLTSGGHSIETGWKFYDERPFLSGLFFWTGFDYRGEPNPLVWPAVVSEFGILDNCGFPKDVFYYLQSWWQPQPVLHLLPHWNWQGREGQEMNVWAQSNCDEVELFLNNKSLGKQAMPKNGHLEWKVKYAPGVLLAKGYKAGKQIITDKVETTGNPASVQLAADKTTINADGQEVSVITVRLTDSKGNVVPTANNEVMFSIEGPGKIIGVGNGDPASHEPDVYADAYSRLKIENLKSQFVDSEKVGNELTAGFDDSNWKAFAQQDISPENQLLVIRGTIQIDELADNMVITLITKSLVNNQSVYVNGQLLGKDINLDDPNQVFVLQHAVLKKGTNSIVFVGKPLRKKQMWDNLNTDPGVVGVKQPAAGWKRLAFNGLAQIIVQSTQQGGTIKLKATSGSLKPAEILIQTKAVALRPAVTE